MNDKQNSLRQKVIDVFTERNPPPLHERIVEDHDDASEKLRAKLDGISWWTASSELVDENYDKLPLLTPEAYHYYIPAFLLRSLDDFEPNNLTLEFTLYSLSPTKTSRDDPWYAARQSHFTREQIDVIRSFLQLILDDDSFYSLYEPAERALRKFWN